MRTARDERLHELTLAYMEKDILGKKWLWTFLLLMGVIILMTVFDSVLFSLLFPAVFLVSNIRYQIKKRQILESYIGEERAVRQWRFWIIYQIILYTIFVILMVATMDRPFWQMWLSLMLILIPLYAVCEWMFKKLQLRDDPDFVSDQEVHKNV
ncbi:hypothetical protein [Exiguobacterium undae]|uniref:hypothetical protein n=1 Tax=Exiguobacterium undae TaxID=169177 RepID=UPI00047BB1C5|nr:hypothetical protein [Exiguobacterium undae]